MTSFLSVYWTANVLSRLNLFIWACTISSTKKKSLAQDWLYPMILGSYISCLSVLACRKATFWYISLTAQDSWVTCLHEKIDFGVCKWNNFLWINSSAIALSCNGLRFVVLERYDSDRIRNIWNADDNSRSRCDEKGPPHYQNFSLILGMNFEQKLFPKRLIIGNHG